MPSNSPASIIDSSPLSQRLKTSRNFCILLPSRPVHRPVSSRRHKTGQPACYLTRTTHLLSKVFRQTIDDRRDRMHTAIFQSSSLASLPVRPFFFGQSLSTYPLQGVSAGPASTSQPNRCLACPPSVAFCSASASIASGRWSRPSRFAATSASIRQVDPHRHQEARPLRARRPSHHRQPQGPKQPPRRRLGVRPRLH